jgi:hypothetical protein
MEKKFKSVVEEFYAKGEDFLIKAFEYGENEKNIDRDEDFNLAVQKPENAKIIAETGQIKGRTSRNDFIDILEDMLKKVNINITDLYDIALLPKTWSEFNSGKKDFLDRETVYAIVLEIYSLQKNPDPQTFLDDLDELLYFLGLRFVPETIALDRIIYNHIKTGIFEIEDINKIIDDENKEIRRLNQIIGGKIKYKSIPRLGPQERKK